MRASIKWCIGACLILASSGNAGFSGSKATAQSRDPDLVMTMCNAEPIGLPGPWAWRTIDGVQCWYRGPRNKPKGQLYWPAVDPIEAQKKSPADESAGR